MKKIVDKKIVIGFLTWRDFVEVIQAAQPRVRVVWVQDYHVYRDPRFSMVEFLLDAAFDDGERIYLARFHLGNEPRFLLDDPQHQKRLSERISKAKEILRNALADLGVEVRQGVYIDAQDARIETSPDGLWRWERVGDELRLIPEAETST